MKSVEVIKKTIDNNQKKPSDKKRRVAAYCRVSTDFDDQKVSYESQKSFYKQYIDNNSNWIFAGIYADEAITGTKVDKRIQFQQMIQDAKDGKIDLILCKSISRFARNTVDTLQYVRALKEAGAEVYFEEENIHTLSMDGELLLTILSSVAQQEVMNISEHVKHGINHRMQQGIMVGAPACYGYDYDPEKKELVINKEQAEVVRYIFDRYIHGVGASTIGRELEKKGIKTKRGQTHWYENVVLNIIKNEKVVGDLLQGKTYSADPISKTRKTNYGEHDQYLIKDHHEPIVSREVFETAQKILEKRTFVRGENNRVRKERYSRKYPFSSKLYCGFCGELYIRKVWHPKTNHATIRWACRKKTDEFEEKCVHSKYLSEKMIEDSFVYILNSLIDNKSSLSESVLEKIKKESGSSATLKQIKNIERGIDKYKKLLDKLLETYLDGTINRQQFKEKRNEISEKLDNLEKDLYVSKGLYATVKESEEQLQDLEKRIKRIDKIEEFDKELFDLLVEKVIIGEETHEIIDPYKITFVFKVGNDQSVNGLMFRTDRRRKNPLHSYTENDEFSSHSYTNDKAERSGECHWPFESFHQQL